MSTIILSPNAVGTNSNLSSNPVEAANLNFDKINNYPNSMGLERYVFEINNTNEDSYNIINLESLAISINAFSVIAKCAQDVITNACTVEPLLYLGAFFRSTSAFTLSLTFTEYSFTWNSNPNTNEFWLVSDFDDLEIGLRLISSGIASSAICSQLYCSLDISIINEIVSNDLDSDTVHLGQDFSIVASEDNGRSLFSASTIKILYKKPDGTEGELNGVIIDQNRIIANFSSALNDQTGKYWFKYKITLLSGEILEGIPFFTNVQPKWI